MSMDRRSFVKSGMAAMAGLSLGEIIQLFPGSLAQAAESAQAQRSRRLPQHRDYSEARWTKTTCGACPARCPVEGALYDGRVVALRGQVTFPGMGGAFSCARALSALASNHGPERLLFPLKRVGKRGEGLWKRIPWHEAYAEISERVQAQIDRGTPQQVYLQHGRSDIVDIANRFLNAIGSPSRLDLAAARFANHSTAHAVALGETGGGWVDVERCRLLFNFGGNPLVAGQNSVVFSNRLQRARQQAPGKRVKLVTFDVRLSETAAHSDEWHAPKPGGDQALALAMGHVIQTSGEYEIEFVARWLNVGRAALAEFYRDYTPEWAELLCGIPAAEIRRLALEFAAARTQAVAIAGRGVYAQSNGLAATRAILMLNALAGSIGMPGGYAYGTQSAIDPQRFPHPEISPLTTRRRHPFDGISEWSLGSLQANYAANRQLVAGCPPPAHLLYRLLGEDRLKVSVLFSYAAQAPSSLPDARREVLPVLTDETRLPFHVCSDIAYSETAHYADLLLPDASWLERWGLEPLALWSGRAGASVRQPLQEPPGQCTAFADVLFEVGRHLSSAIAQHFRFNGLEDYYRQRSQLVPRGDAPSGLDRLRRDGFWADQPAPALPHYLRRLQAAEMASARTEEATRLIRKRYGGREMTVGIMFADIAYAGFATPSRRFEIASPLVEEAAQRQRRDDDGWPHWQVPPGHELVQPDGQKLALTFFKWPVHTGATTASQKLAAEITHDDPLWMNRLTADKLGLKQGDSVLLALYRIARGESIPGAVVRLRLFVTEGIHPLAVALSGQLGHRFGGRVAIAHNGERPQHPGYDRETLPEDEDLLFSIWWDAKRGGRGPGVVVGGSLPLQLSPLTAAAAGMGIVCEVRKG